MGIGYCWPVGESAPHAIGQHGTFPLLDAFFRLEDVPLPIIESDRMGQCSAPRFLDLFLRHIWR